MHNCLSRVQTQSYVAGVVKPLLLCCYVQYKWRLGAMGVPYNGWAWTCCGLTMAGACTKHRPCYWSQTLSLSHTWVMSWFTQCLLLVKSFFILVVVRPNHGVESSKICNDTKTKNLILTNGMVASSGRGEFQLGDRNPRRHLCVKYLLHDLVKRFRTPGPWPLGA